MSLQLGLLNPALPGEITQAGMLACFGRAAGVAYPQSVRPSTAAIATGFRQGGTLAALPEITMGRETETIRTGAYGLPQAILFKSLNASLKAEFYGFDAYLLSLGLGVDPVVTVGTGTTFSAITVDPTTGYSHVSETGGTFSVGDTVQVCATTDTAFSTNFAKVLDTTSGLLLDRLLRETPASGTISKVVKTLLPIGGLTPKQFSFAGLVDFPAVSGVGTGPIGVVSFPLVQCTKPLVIPIGDGQAPVKVPLEMEALGALDATYGVLVGSVTVWQ